MEYVIAAVVVVLLAVGAVTLMVSRATSRRGQEPTPLGDTGEHAGEQTEHGTTVRDPERERERERERFRREDPDAAAHVGRPGEGEGREALGFEGERPGARRH
jgi:hypothetical protein